MKPDWHWSNKTGAERADILKRISVGWGKKPKTGKWVTCPTCGKKVWKKLYFIKRSKELFCSSKCHNLSKKGKTPENFEMFRAKSPFRKGKENINWKGGISPYPREWKGSIRQKVWARDKSTCQLCGKVAKEGEDCLVVHHIDFNKVNCKIDNLQLLCRSCHMKIHWQYRKQLITGR